jgi:hypothetical protein
LVIGVQFQSYRVITPGTLAVVMARNFAGWKAMPNIPANAEEMQLDRSVASLHGKMPWVSSA